MRRDDATRRSGDGRSPVENCTEFFDVAVHQVRPSGNSSRSPESASRTPEITALEGAEVTILTAWAEAISEAVAYAPERLEATLADAGQEAPWRAELGIDEPSVDLSDGIESMSRAVRTAKSAGHDALEALLS